jgi:hypothetical protein
LAIAGRAGSQVYSLIAALCVVAVLFVAGPLMAPLPWAALGGVVLYAASKLVSIPEFRRPSGPPQIAVEYPDNDPVIFTGPGSVEKTHRLSLRRPAWSGRRSRTRAWWALLDDAVD